MGSVWQPKNWVLACRGGFRFEVCFGFTIRDFFFFLLLIFPLSCVCKLGNTNKCYPPLCSNISKPSCLNSPLLTVLFSPSPFYKFKNVFLLSGWLVVTKALVEDPSGPAFSVPQGRPSRLSSSDTTTLGQYLWPIHWWPYVIPGEVERESGLEPGTTQAAIRSISHPNRATHLALSLYPSSQKRHLHIPEKKIYHE